MDKITSYQEFKKRVLEGNVYAKVLICNNPKYSPDPNALMKIVKANSTAICFGRTLSNIEISISVNGFKFYSNLFQFEGNILNIYNPLLREMTDDERRVYEKAKLIAVGALQWKGIEESDYPYLQTTIQCKSKIGNKIRDGNIKGQLMYQLLFAEEKDRRKGLAR